MTSILSNKKQRLKLQDSFTALSASTKLHFFAAFFLFICAGLMQTKDVLAADTDRSTKRVAVFISREIKPYLQAVETLSQRLNEDGRYRLKQFFFDASEKNDLEIFRKQILKGEYDLVVTIGDQTSSYMAEHLKEVNIPVVYTMLINPEDIFNPEDKISGVSLNIPIESQLKEIKRTLPNINIIGVLFDPKYNAKFVQEAIAFGKTMNLNIVAITVSEKASIPKALNANWYRIESLWLIPDWTVTSADSINQYIIKEALLRKVPVIGYNRSFYNYGAAVALILDYEKIGIQTAEIVIDSLENGISRNAAPEYETDVNQRVLKQMGIEGEKILDREMGWK